MLGCASQVQVLWPKCRCRPFLADAGPGPTRRFLMQADSGSRRTWPMVGMVGRNTDHADHGDGRSGGGAIFIWPSRPTNHSLRKSHFLYATDQILKTGADRPSLFGRCWTGDGKLWGAARCASVCRPDARKRPGHPESRPANNGLRAAIDFDASRARVRKLFTRVRKESLHCGICLVQSHDPPRGPPKEVPLATPHRPPAAFPVTNSGSRILRLAKGFACAPSSCGRLGWSPSSHDVS